jgi:hypothetical protein
MPALKNTSHEQFCLKIVGGSKPEQAARDVGLFPNSRPRSFMVQAHRLARRKEIMRRIAALSLRGENRVAKDFKVTREWLISQLVSNVLQAKELGQVAAANKALEMLGNNQGGDCSFIQRAEVHNFWDEEVDLAALTDEQLRRGAAYFERLAWGKDQAAALAARRRALLEVGAPTDVVDVEFSSVESMESPTTPEPAVITQTTTVAPTAEEIEDPLEGL